jgi:hypothetical protein
MKDKKPFQLLSQGRNGADEQPLCSAQIPRGRIACRSGYESIEIHDALEMGLIGDAPRVAGAAPPPTASPNHLLHLEVEGRGNGEGEGLSSLEVEDGLELPGLLHEQVARIGPLADFVARDGGVQDLVGPVRAGRHEAPHFCRLPKAVPRQSPVLSR